MLTPRSESTDDWSYSTAKVADLGSDIGRPSIADVDQDGLADIFVPLYNAKKVAHYTFTEPVVGPQVELQIWSFKISRAPRLLLGRCVVWKSELRKMTGVKFMF